MGFYTTEPVDDRGVVIEKRAVRFFSDGHHWNALSRQTNSPASKAFHAVVLRTTAPGVPLYGYRHLSTELGRWVRRDPIKERGGLNVYGFVGNSALLLVDYLGLAPQLCGIDSRGMPVYCPNPPGDYDNPYPEPGQPDNPPAVPSCPATKTEIEGQVVGVWKFCRDRQYPHKDPISKCSLDCYRSWTDKTYGPGQQCCYDKTGKLAPGELGTSPDIVSPVVGIDDNGDCIITFGCDQFILHCLLDWLPAKCEQLAEKCGEFNLF